MAKHSEARRVYGLARRVAQVASGIVLVGALAAIVATVLVPRLVGGTPYTILTGSMRPSLPPGTIVVTRPVPVDEIGIGSVITFQLESGEGAVATHRVVGIASTVTGERSFITQGDANDAADAEPVQPVQIKGAVWYHVPYLGYLTSRITAAERQLVETIAIIALFAYAAWMIASEIRDRARVRRTGRSSPEHVHG